MGEDFSYREIGTYPLPNKPYNGYLGILFNGTSPGDGEINDVLNEAGINEEDIE